MQNFESCSNSMATTAYRRERLKVFTFLRVCKINNDLNKSGCQIMQLLLLFIP